MLELRHVAKTYNPGTVTEMCLFRDFNLTVPKGQFISVVGSNGSGKTSLLNIICGSIRVDAGEVCINGECVNTRKEFQRYRSIGRVYQNPALGTCGSMSILENLSLAANKCKTFGLGRAVDRRRVQTYREQLAELGLGLENKLDMAVGALSGGQRQAVALLMATMTPLDFLILDEHTAALDSAHGGCHHAADRPSGARKKADGHYGDAQPALCSGVWRPAADDGSRAHRHGQKRRGKSGGQCG